MSNTQIEDKGVLQQIQELIQKEQQYANLQINAQQNYIDKLKRENVSLKSLATKRTTNAIQTNSTSFTDPFTLVQIDDDVFGKENENDGIHPSGRSDVLNLQGDHLFGIDPVTTLRTLLQVPGLTGIDLSGSVILSDDHAYMLAELLTKYTNFTRIRLCDVPQLNNQTARVLTECIPNAHHLRSLDLTGNWFNGFAFATPPNELSQEFTKNIADVMEAALQCPNLIHLGISICDDLALHALIASRKTSQTTAHPNTSTDQPKKVIRKHRNGSKPKGKANPVSPISNIRGSSLHLVALFREAQEKAQRSSPAKRGSNASQNFPIYLRSLSLRGSRLSKEGLHSLLTPAENPLIAPDKQKGSPRARDRNPSTTPGRSLLRRNPSRSKTRARNPDSQKQGPTSEKDPRAALHWAQLRLSTFSSFLSNLLCLDLSFTYCGGSKAQALSRALLSTSTFTMFGTHASKFGLQTLMPNEKLPEAPVLRSLQSLNLKGCALYGRTSAHLLAAIVGHPRLCRVCLRQNKLHHEGAKTLSLALQLCFRKIKETSDGSLPCHLELLDIMYNDIPQPDWSDLMKAVEEHPKLILVASDGIDFTHMWDDPQQDPTSPADIIAKLSTYVSSQKTLRPPLAPSNETSAPNVNKSSLKRGGKSGVRTYRGSTQIRSPTAVPEDHQFLSLDLTKHELLSADSLLPRFSSKSVKLEFDNLWKSSQLSNDVKAQLTALAIHKFQKVHPSDFQPNIHKSSLSKGVLHQLGNYPSRNVVGLPFFKHEVSIVPTAIDSIFGTKDVRFSKVSSTPCVAMLNFDQVTDDKTSAIALWKMAFVAAGTDVPHPSQVQEKLRLRWRVAHETISMYSTPLLDGEFINDGTNTAYEAVFRALHENHSVEHSNPPSAFSLGNIRNEEVNAESENPIGITAMPWRWFAVKLSKSIFLDQTNTRSIQGQIAISCELLAKSISHNESNSETESTSTGQLSQTIPRDKLSGQVRIHHIELLHVTHDAFEISHSK